MPAGKDHTGPGRIRRRTDLPGASASGGDRPIPDRELQKVPGQKKNISEIAIPKTDKSMIKRFFTSKVGRTITSIIGGIIGFGGSTFAGLDPDFAILVAATAVVAIFLGIDKAARFKELFDGDLDKKGGR